MTMKEAAYLVGRTERTLYLWIARGWLPRYKTSTGRVSFNRNDVIRAQRVADDAIFANPKFKTKPKGR